MGVGRVISNQNFGHTSDLRSCFGYSANALACNQNVDVATDFGGSGYGVQRGRSQCLAVVFCDYQDSHD